MMNVMETPISAALGMAVLSGMFAIGWAVAGFLRLRILMAILFPVQFVVMGWVSKRVERGARMLSDSSADHSVMHHRLLVEGTLALWLIILGYVMVVAFVRKEGNRIFGTLTEVKLAREVHNALVPVISRRLGQGQFEVYGTSISSGMMGGDLVDVVEDGDGWIAYVADVSGHGVSAGMIMAMVKSATRMGSTQQSSLSQLFSKLNQVLASLSAANVFVTFACISGGNGSELGFSLAGHLPILHYRKQPGTVEEKAVSNLPLAVIPDTHFDSSSIQCEPGDVLAILTDGLTEISDKQGREVGLEPLKAILADSADKPLSQIVEIMRDNALRHGKQTDDQTVLLLRRV